MNAAELDAVRITLAPGASFILPLIIAMIMMSVALTLRVESFAFLRTQPLRFLGAASAQIIALPLLTLALVNVLNPVPSIALGMIVVACCPGGMISNFLTHLARGDTALSVSLTATSSLAAALLTPVSIIFWSSLYAPAAALVDAINVSPVPFIVQTTMLLAAPLAAGMVIAHYAPQTARRVRPFFTIAAFTGLIAMVAGGVASNWDLLIGTGLLVLAIAILHNGLALALGSASGRLLKLDGRGRRSMTFEVGIQNTGLGLVILLGQFDGLGGAAAITAIWSVWHLVSGLTLAGGFRLLDRRRAAAARQTG